MNFQIQDRARPSSSEAPHVIASKELSISLEVGNQLVRSGGFPKKYRAALASEDNALSIALFPKEDFQQRKVIYEQVNKHVMCVGATGLVQAVCYEPAEFILVYRNSDHRREAFQPLNRLLIDDRIGRVEKVGPRFPRQYITWSVQLHPVGTVTRTIGPFFIEPLCLLDIGDADSWVIRRPKVSMILPL